VRRHPHVFGDQRAKDAEEVLKNWHQIKAQERRSKAGVGEGSPPNTQPESALDGVTRALPATLEGLHLTKKAARTGFDWDDNGGIFGKILEESAELRKAVESGRAAEIEEETGDLLFAAVNLARFLHIDPEIALKKANAKFVRRFHEMERLAAANGRKFTDVPRAEKEALWDSAKEAALPSAARKTQKMGSTR
jgi:MazG family protein